MSIYVRRMSLTLYISYVVCIYVLLVRSGNIETNPGPNIQTVGKRTATTTQVKRHCIFEHLPTCKSSKSNPLANAGKARIHTVIAASISRGDTIHIDLQKLVDSSDDNVTVPCHRSCVNFYTSKLHIQRQIRDEHQPNASKRVRCDDEFNLSENCIFCGKLCNVDDRNPNRQLKSSYFTNWTCATKNLILKACAEHNDKWGDTVRTRISAAISDLAATKAQYHINCKVAFMFEKKNANPSCSGDNPIDAEPSPFDRLIAHMTEDDTTLFWDSITVYNIYTRYGGDLCKKTLMAQMVSRFEDDIIVLKAKGLADMITFKNKSKGIMKVVKEYQADQNEIDKCISVVAQCIINELKAIPTEKTTYRTSIDKSVAAASSSRTLCELLEKVSPRLESKSLTSIMVGNMVTGAVTQHPTPLQIDLGVYLRDRRAIDIMYRYGSVCSYDEVSRFKKSAATAGSVSITTRGIVSRNDANLIQVIVDNFDANISSQNCTLSTHALAMIVTQNASDNDNVGTETEAHIPRLRKADMSKAITKEVIIERYRGPKIPPMTKSAATAHVLPLAVLSRQALSAGRASSLDFKFLKDITSVNNCPEYNGYNSMKCREENHKAKQKTNVVYLPLLDMKPAEPDTIMTAMVEAERVTNEAGQTIVVFTADQQLYRIAVDITWVYPERFRNFVLRLGGMHTVMSFLGALGWLMAGTGLCDIMTSAFASTSHMLSGKKYPQNIRALRIVVEEIIRNIVQNQHPTDMNELMLNLEKLSKKSRTAKLWTDVLIKGVLIASMFVRAERENDWGLHLYALQQMMPYFFASGHHNYARYALYYIWDSTKIRDATLDKFLDGQHTQRHKAGVWNSMWSDMFIETTYMRHGHGPNGIIGNTLNSNALAVWAHGMHASSKVIKDIHDLTTSGSNAETEVKHKEEHTSRITHDNSDRNKIREKLSKCFDPLSDIHPNDVIINIVTGQTSKDIVNVDNALQIGTDQMHAYIKTLPEGFHKTISKKVTTMQINNKHIKVGNSKLYDTNLIYSRVLGLQATRGVDIEDVLQFELSPVPTSMFSDDGTMRIATTKCSLKTELAVYVDSARHIDNPSDIVIDGCALLWCVAWPTNGTINDFVNNLIAYIQNKLFRSNVHLIFDRYREFSPKDGTRVARLCKNGGSDYKLTLGTPLPDKKTLLSVSANKKMLITIVSQTIHDREVEFLEFDHFLIVTDQNDVPFQVGGGIGVCPRNDLINKHEEADVIIVNQVKHITTTLSSSNDTVIKVVADDTDVFILLIHFINSLNLAHKIFMQSPISDRGIIDMAETTRKCSDIAPSLLAGHALTGCDCVAQYFGIGKVRMLKVIRSGFKLTRVGQIDSNMSDVIGESTEFMLKCYGVKKSHSMTTARYNSWLDKISNKTRKKSPTLKSLPPTDESFRENVKRAHLQACTWMAATESEPPNLDPLAYGWFRDATRHQLQPVTMPLDVRAAPDEIMSLVACSCKSTEPCRTNKCGCSSAKLACTSFCACRANSSCCNTNQPLSDNACESDGDDDVDDNVDDE